MIVPLTLVLDLLGLILVSWSLFSIPEPTTLTFDSEYGVLTDLRPIADAINEVSRNFQAIHRMRFGFAVLVLSWVIKFGHWAYSTWTQCKGGI